MVADLFEDKEQHIERLIALLKNGDRDEACKMLKSWGQKFNYQKAISDILDPALAKFGQDWSRSEKVSLGQAYVLGKVAEDIFELAAKECKKQDSTPAKGPVIIGNSEDDTHALGRKLVISFLKLEGWQVVDLGSDVTAEEFIEAAVQNNAPIIGVSAMMLRTAMNIKKLREELDQKGLSDKIQLAVGGAVFCQRPELVQEVGGDGTASNAILTPALFDELLEKSHSKGGV